METCPVSQLGSFLVTRFKMCVGGKSPLPPNLEHLPVRRANTAVKGIFAVDLLDPGKFDQLLLLKEGSKKIFTLTTPQNIEELRPCCDLVHSIATPLQR